VVDHLVRWADVIVENFAGGVMDRMGLSYERLRAIRPDIIVISASIFGQTGPYSSARGYGGTLTALTGIPHISGFPDQPPQFPAFAITDYISPRIAMLAVISALDYRRRTGKGQYLDAAQVESTLAMMGPIFLNFQANGIEAVRMGNRSSRYSPYGVYRCKGEDRWCSIAVTNEEEWLSFCHTVGNPPWTLLPEFTTMNGRIVHAADLDRHIEDWTRDKDPESIMKMLEETGVAAGIVQKGRDLDSDPQLAYRNFYSELDHPGLGSITYGGMPVEFSDTEWEMRRAPYLGEHNEQLLIKEIGMNPDDYSKLKADGVFE
jgi:benzylsuccinate CoA-transferase BbsF subunit